jgi:hypothetical protein
LRHKSGGHLTGAALLSFSVNFSVRQNTDL